MAFSRDVSILGAMMALLFALATTFIFGDNSSTSRLYCTSGSSITTLNVSAPHAQCFRVQNGIFTEVLSGAPIDEQFTVLDGYVFPGLIDGHGHLLQYGEMLESVSLYEARSMSEVRERVVEWLSRHRGEGYGTRDKWIRGVGWDQAYFEGIMPTAAELSQDPELAGLYIMLDRVDVHCVLTSQKVLDLLPSPLPKSPPGGVVVMNPGPGVFCDNAMDAIVYPHAPKPDKAQRTRWFQTAMSELNKLGIVGVGDAGMRPEDVAILEEMAEKDELTLRVNVMLECAERNTYCPDETKSLKLLNAKDGLGDSMLILGGVKLFVDGALGSWGAAMLEDYSDRLGTKGTMLINETELTAVVKSWYDFGFQLNLHAIGDRANRAAVDAFENVLGTDCDGCNQAKRSRIEHAQIIHPEDQKRIEKMGIIPSIQPTHATSDMAYAIDRLGDDRTANSAYRMASFFPSDAPDSQSRYPGPVLGSDFPVEPPNPFHGMFAAVTRLNPLTGTSPVGLGGWQPEQKLSLEQALNGFTKNPAYGWFKEDKAGAIEVGKWADFVVLDIDLLGDEMRKSEGRNLKDVVIRETWTAGRKVWPRSLAEDDGRNSNVWELVVQSLRRWATI